MYYTGNAIRLKATIPFSQRLNDWISKHLSEKGIEYSGSDKAPENWEETKEQNRYNLFVSNKFCENTIFGTIEANIAFRAWHDYTHIANNLSFEPLDEIKVAFLQAAELPKDWHYERMLIISEVAGQVLYHSTFEFFPENQRKFTINLLETGKITI